MAKSLSTIINAALRGIGEPEITAFTSGSILEAELISEANSRVRRLVSDMRQRWALGRHVLQLTDDISAQYVSVTNGSATVTSVDADGVSYAGFGSVAAGMKIKVSSDETAYKVLSTNVTATPHTLVIEANYNGTTDTSAGCVIYRDIYPITGVTDLDELVMVGFPEAGRDIRVVDMRTIFLAAGGNLALDAGGKPRLVARIEPDASNNPQFLFWPYPKDDYPVELWYTRFFTEQSSFSATLFGADAPEIAYDFVEFGVRARACLYDNDERQASYWEQRAGDALRLCRAREARDHQDDNTLKVETYRRRVYGIESRSQVAFDTKTAWR